jgi:hypothetical protein
VIVLEIATNIVRTAGSCGNHILNFDYSYKFETEARLASPPLVKKQNHRGDSKIGSRHEEQEVGTTAGVRDRFGESGASATIDGIRPNDPLLARSALFGD